jgi:hypothetical protein
MAGPQQDWGGCVIMRRPPGSGARDPSAKFDLRFIKTSKKI